MPLSFVGMMSGLSAAVILIVGCIFGLFIIYVAKKNNAKLLLYFGLTIISASLAWLGDLVDFVTILLTGRNMDNSYGLKGILGYIWVPFTFIMSLYIGAEVLIPEKKRYFLALFLILGVFFELFLFLDPLGSFEITYPATPGEDIIDENLSFNSPAGIIFAILFISYIIFWGIGFLYKGFQSTGILKKKFILMSIGAFLFMAFAIFDTSLPHGIFTVIVRIGILISYWIMYLGIREETEKKEKTKPKKDVKVKSDLFRISKYKKEDITEEEVSISKEKKVCLVCKGKVLGFNNFICYECEIFYCEKCARALIEIENACWACGAPFDKSKPVNPFKKEEEIEEIEISEKLKK